MTQGAPAAAPPRHPAASVGLQLRLVTTWGWPSRKPGVLMARKRTTVLGLFLMAAAGCRSSQPASGQIQPDGGTAGSQFAVTARRTTSRMPLLPGEPPVHPAGAPRSAECPGTVVPLVRSGAAGVAGGRSGRGGGGGSGGVQRQWRLGRESGGRRGHASGGDPGQALLLPSSCEARTQMATDDSCTLYAYCDSIPYITTCRRLDSGRWQCSPKLATRSGPTRLKGPVGIKRARWRPGSAPKTR